ncbi:LuxR C-terminal-related transcriptional regulator [Streptomyces sp. NPDC101191]|uniref:helix-turn-helix transcriptional regulator n=1 Tax=Streptomyces sp. NPDC101191 TaxID=3366126 RepID=UPI0037FFD387
MSGASNFAAAPRLYDRTSELATVAALSARAAEGAGSVLLLTARAGIGRTALLDRAVRDSRVRAHRVAAPTGNRVPWSGVRALLSALAPTPSAARRALRTARGPGGVPGALEVLCPGEPLLLCLDDLHRWDAYSRTSLDAAWRGNPGPWAWVVSFAAYHRPPDVPGARLLSLGRLSRAGAGALLDDRCRGPLTTSFRSRLLDEAAGHPGVLAAAAARVSAEPERGGCRPGTLTDDALLSEVYRGLLDSLPAECGRVLTLVAVAGEPLPGTGEPDPPAGRLTPVGPVGADAVRPVGADADGEPSGSSACATAEADPAERDFREGLCAALGARLQDAHAPLARVVARDGSSDEPRRLVRAGAAALVLGDAPTAVRVHTRALAAVRATAGSTLLPRVLEHLAYAELRAGQHERAAAHARDGLRAAELAGQRNPAAHQHAILALAASVRGDAQAVVEHADRALGTARAHGLVQATTLAEWAIARAELAGGLAAQAAARLAPLVRRGPRGGHFALRMLVVPCFVEAACAAGREADAGTAAEEFAVWAGFGLDPQAPAQLARCRALLAGAGDSADWYREAVRHHEDSGNDFERARTLLAYGKWLRRRRRLVEARGPLGDALVTFERAAAGVWADQARAELRATGGPVRGRAVPGAAGELTPQQQRIAGLVAAGATNHEIADRLSVSPRTVDHHLRNVFARLGVRSRVELSGLLSRTTGNGHRSDR